MGWFRGSSEKSQGYVVEAHAIAIPVVDVEPSAPLPPPSNPQYRQSSPIIRHQLRLSIKSPRYPAFLTECPYCHVQNSTTRTRTAPALLTLLACIAISLLFWPICWLPLVLDWMKKTEHYCRNCQMMVGEVPPLQGCCVKHRR